MTLGARIAWDDTVLPFRLDRPDLRGRVARLEATLGRVLARHAYPPAVEALVAEALVLTALVGQAVKLRWKLSLQVRGKGPIRLIATDYFAPEADGAGARLRAWAGFDGPGLDPAGAPFDQIGPGHLAVTIDQGQGTLPYQGITALAGGSLAACAETYFAQSEQLPTRFRVGFRRTGDGWRAGGVMLQRMPPAAPPAAAGAGAPGPAPGRGEAAADAAAEDWGRAALLLDTATTAEIAGPEVQPTDLLVRLFHDEGPRVFAPRAVGFGCTCSAERVRRSLSIYSAKDIATMTTPAGIVTADCQFCGAHYEFDPRTLGFEAEGAGGGAG